MEGVLVTVRIISKVVKNIDFGYYGFFFGDVNS